MRIPSTPFASLVLITSIVLASPSSRAAPRDPAQRGLDLFVHAPSKVAAGGRLSVQVRVFGFPTVSTLTPLAGAHVAAAWDPESLGAGASAPPPAVTTTADDSGRAHLDVAVPLGAGPLKLLLSASWRDHERTRTITITRVKAREIDLRVSDTSVLPGGTVSTWLMVRDLTSGRPLPGASVDVQLKEGAVSRFSRRLSTDQAGMAALRVPVPFTENPDWTWTLTARTAFATGENAEASRILNVREETPSAPTLSARWAQPTARPGARTTFHVQVRDGSGLPLSGLPVRTWVGPRGTTAPTDDRAWALASTPATTDGAGTLTVPVDAPSPVSRRGTTLTVVVKALVDGHPLSATDTLAVELPRPKLEVVPEYGTLLPGLSQRLFVRATRDAQPLAGDFVVEGHGLSTRLRTNQRGWGQVLWTVPPTVGAKVPAATQTGCAGEVAATVQLRPLSHDAGSGALSSAISLCIPIDRDAAGTVRAARPLVTAGDAIDVAIIEAKGAGGTESKRRPSRDAPSVLLVSPDEAIAASTWLVDGARGGTVRLPAFGLGVWTLSAAGTTGKAARRQVAVENPDEDDIDVVADAGRRVLAGSVLVVPRVLPRLVARRIEKTEAPRDNTVTLEAELTDGKGHPLVGSVGAVVIDKNGGAHPENLLALDTRRATVARLGIADDDVDGFLEGDSRYDIERAAAMARLTPTGVTPAFDPFANADADIDKAFGAIVRSLEGGVFESSADPETLSDVRIHTARGFGLNPEMLTLTTLAMETPPETPGGEPWRLTDLMAIDRQVNYDNVARRVTRLKLFRVLAAARSFIHENRLGPDEPMLTDPNALLRRLVRKEALATGDLLDPWGRGLAFIRAPGPRIPFLSIVPGYHLRSAGPDGHFGTADDVRDPFQRVLKSRTPYANAVEEDRIVDSRWDMHVGDDTVDAWKETLEKLTGTSLGDLASDQGYGSGDLGLGGVGSGGGGMGRGYAGVSRGIDVGPSEWLPPVRTDDHGHVRLTVPLGSADTTWQILLVGMPDQGSPAVTSLDVPVSSSLSLSVNTGASWIAGDQVGVAVALHNRTDKPLSATLQVTASGVAALVESRQRQRAVVLPARSTTSAIVFVAAKTAGGAGLDATLSATGLPSFSVHHDWTVKPAGEALVASDAVWVEREATLSPSKNPHLATATGPARLILERGLEPALQAALESLRPERLTGVRGVADALEVFGRVRAWALVRGGDTAPLAIRARELALLAGARTPLEPSGRDELASHRPLLKRARSWELTLAPPSGAAPPPPPAVTCPPSKTEPLALSTKLDWLEVAPHVAHGTEVACWSAFAATALQQLAVSHDPLLLARAVLAQGDGATGALVAGALADRLRAAVSVGGDGTLVLPSGAADRATRSIVMAALLRARKMGTVNASTTASAARLWIRLLIERDADGGYGSAQATRFVVRTLLDGEPPRAAVSATVDWSVLSADGRASSVHRVALGASQSMTLPLPPSAVGVRIGASMPGVLARLERPLLRSFLRPPEPDGGPLHLQLEAPHAATAEGTALLQLSVRHDLEREAPVVIRVPLPPGATLAEKVEGVRQVQGVLYVRTTLDSDPLPRVIPIPLHFALSGTVTLPEVVARIDDEELAVARTPARPFSVGAPRPPAGPPR